MRFPNSSHDEIPIASEVASRYGISHDIIDVGTRDVDDLLPRLAWQLDQPLFDAAAVPNYLIQKELRKTVKVSINGSGGDELFAGYNRYFPLKIEQQYTSLPSKVRECLEWIIEPLSPMTTFRLRRAEKYFDRPGEYLTDHTGHFPAPMRKFIGNKMASGESAQQKAYELASGSHQTRMLTADLQTYLVDDLMALIDRTSMGVGVEARVPFLDHIFIETALGVPEQLRTEGFNQKALQRRIARRFLPKTVVEAPKTGFISPVPSWWRGSLGISAMNLLTRPKTLERGWWSTRGISLLFSDLEQYGFQIYTLVMLELCIRLFVEKQPISKLSEMARAG